MNMTLSEAIKLFSNIFISPCEGSWDHFSEKQLNPLYEARKVILDALRWRPFPDEKPSKCGYYLVSRKDGWTDQLFYDSNTSMFYKWSEECTRTNFNNMITHWLPINGPEVTNETE